MANLSHFRCQHPVGQGFFHTGSMKCGRSEFHYVYDCGSEHHVELSQCIHHYVRELEDTRTLDALFISHFHADHVNGLDQLLGELRAKKVVLPYLSKIERFALLVTAAFEQPVSTSYVQMLANPIQWFSDRGVDEIVVVMPRDRLPPEWNVEQSPNEGMPPDEGSLYLNIRRSSNVPDDMLSGSSPQFRSCVSATLDSHAMKLYSTGTWLGWVFVPFVHPEPTRLKVFIKTVRKRFPDFENTADWLTRILQASTPRADLANCYDAIRKNRNLTSLSLYSGPDMKQGSVRPSSIVPFSLDLLRPQCLPCLLAARLLGRGCGWLGTGDAALLGKRRLAKFLKHDNRYLKDVLTLTLPHHGSKHNSDKGLIDGVGAAFHIAAAGNNSRYGHPDPAVRKTVESGNRIFVHVDENWHSMWREGFNLEVVV